MLLKCRTIRKDEFGPNQRIRDALFSPLGYRRHDATYSTIEVGKYYVAFALKIRAGVPTVLVKNHKHPDDWVFRPLACFDVVDERLSRHWRFKADVFKSSVDEKVYTRQEFAIPQWFEKMKTTSFWERLFELERREVAIMNQMSLKMTLEYRLPYIEKTARESHGAVVICSECEHHWKPCKLDEMTKCSMCGEVLHLPA